MEKQRSSRAMPTVVVLLVKIIVGPQQMHLTIISNIREDIRETTLLSFIDQSNYWSYWKRTSKDLGKANAFSIHYCLSVQHYWQWLHSSKLNFITVHKSDFYLSFTWALTKCQLICLLMEIEFREDTSRSSELSEESWLMQNIVQ